MSLEYSSASLSGGLLQGPCSSASRDLDGRMAVQQDAAADDYSRRAARDASVTPIRRFAPAAVPAEHQRRWADMRSLLFLILIAPACSTQMSHRASLIIGMLSVRSSYAQDLEESAAEAGDTIQWWFLEQATWRVRTYALDYDVHAHRVDGVDRQFARDHVRRIYSDVLLDVHEVEFSDFSDAQAVQEALRLAGLGPAVRFSSDGIPMWAPEGSIYTTKSSPR